jgi:flagellar basal-body rod modification protein FlgD
MSLAGTSYSSVSALTTAQQTAATKTGTSTGTGSSTGSTGTASTDPTKALQQLGTNFNQMLQMLTTQLKAQDPTKPMDTTEMSAQLLSITNVQQTVGINSRLDKLLSLEQNFSTGSALGYLGRMVEWDGNQVNLASKSAVLGYEVVDAASSVTVQVMDSKGNVVNSFAGETGVGAHQIAWDGTDSSGKQLADGAYKLNIVAQGTDPEKTPTVKARASGMVSSIESTNGEATLHVGANTVAATKVLAVL